MTAGRNRATRVIRFRESWKVSCLNSPEGRWRFTDREERTPEFMRWHRRPISMQIPEDQIRAYFNQYLPEDIAVLSVEKVPDKFHSRLNAVQKTYLYRIEMGPKKDVFERKYCYGLGKQLSADRMKEAAACVLGEHDFKSFCGNKKMKKSTVKTISDITIEKEGTKLLIRYTGNGFLYHMVRILTGTLIEIGLEERSPQEMKEILLKLDRQAAGFTAPPEGLFLERVMYEDR